MINFPTLFPAFFRVLLLAGAVTLALFLTSFLQAGVPIGESERMELDQRARDLGGDPELARRMFQEQLDREVNQESTGEVQEAISQPMDEVVGPVSPIYWPENPIIATLAVEERIEVLDGFPEKRMVFSHPGLVFQVRSLEGVSLLPHETDCSALFASNLFPNHQVQFYLFPSASWMPQVSEYYLESYAEGLKKTHGDQINFLQDRPWMQRYTFQLEGRNWGKVSYLLKEEAKDPVAWVEFFLPLANRQLVVKITGSRQWVEGRASQMEHLLSGLQILER